MGAVTLPLIQSRRPGSDEGHVSFQYIEKLRQLVNGMLSDEVPDGNNPGIIIQLEHLPFHLVVLHQFVFARIRIRIHTAEFIDPELSAVPSDPDL